MRHDDLHRYRSFYRAYYNKYKPLIGLCAKDQLFCTLIAFMKANQIYINGLGLDGAVREVTWWILRMNISCNQTELYTMEDVKNFALFLVMDLRYSK